MPEWTFLLPLALTIFGFSTSSASSERFSRGVSAGAASSLGGLASFFATLVSATGGTVEATVSTGAVSVFAAGFSASAFGFFGFALSVLGLLGFFSILKTKLYPFSLPDCELHQLSSAGLCACAHLSMFAVRAQVIRGDV